MLCICMCVCVCVCVCVCRCDTTQGILPFTISPRYSQPPSNQTSTTHQFCFTLNTLPPNQLVPVSGWASGWVGGCVQWIGLRRGKGRDMQGRIDGREAAGCKKIRARERICGWPGRAGGSECVDPTSAAQIAPSYTKQH